MNSFETRAVASTAAVLTITSIMGAAAGREMPVAYLAPSNLVSSIAGMSAPTRGISEAQISIGLDGAVEFAVLASLFQEQQRPLSVEIQEFISRNLADYLD